MSKAHLYGYGYLEGYGDYYLVAAENIDEATVLLQKEVFKDFKRWINCARNGANFENGKAVNGFAEIFIYCEENGYFGMDDDTLFESFCKNEFGKDVSCFSHDVKRFNVTDLGTGVWRGETA